jgi:hypothetical protein
MKKKTKYIPPPHEPISLPLFCCQLVSLLVVAIKQNKGKEIGSGSMTEISQVL